MPEQRKLSYTVARFSDVTSESVLKWCPDRQLKSALIFTPDIFWVARIIDASFYVIQGGKETVPDLTRAYEIRAFGVDAELRWVRDGTEGTAIVIADGEFSPPGTAELISGRTLDVLPRRYRLWGRPPRQRLRDGATAAPAGWAALATGRIGTIYVPLPTGAVLSPDGEMELLAREYVVSRPCGNAAILFERLVDFAIVAAS
jgi:CRISPR-associated protein (TIGR03984 family)